jgi:hypothetical protein
VEFVAGSQCQTATLSPSSCPHLLRASRLGTQWLLYRDGRDNPGHDDRKAKRHRPVFCSGDGCACLFLPRKPGGAERRPAHQQNSRHACEPACIAGLMRSGVDIPARDAAPSGAPLRRFWASGPYFRARMERSLDYEPLRPTCLGGFRRPSPCRVQPLKAAPRSWSGRLPLPPGA